MASKNFYELLELDPSVKDRAQIEKVIERKHKEWVRWSDNPVREGEARLCLGLLPRIRKVLLAPESESERQAQEDEYRKHNKSDVEKLDQMLLLDAGKELRILASRFTELIGGFAKTFKNQFTEQQIRERCKQLRISVVSEGTIPEEPNLLDTATYRDIEKNLGIAGENDLYSMLQVPFALKNRQRLLTAAESVLKEARLRPNQAAWTSKAVLAGYCLALFKTDEMQSRYDHTAQHAKIGRVLNQIIDQAAHDGVLTPHEWDHLLKKAQDADISEEIATRYITKRVNVRAGGKSSAAFDKHIKAAYDAVEGNQLTSALEEMERARSIQPDHSDIAILEKRITERQNLGKADAEVRGAIVADNSERTIANAANRRAEFTDKELAPSDRSRVADAQMRVKLLDRFSGVPTEPTQVDDEALMSLWTQSGDVASLLRESMDPECNNLLRIVEDTRQRLQQVQVLKSAARAADKNEAKEADLGPLALALPRGYRHEMEPRLAMSSAILRPIPQAVIKAEAWMKLKSSGYNVEHCYFKPHCEELAKSYSARIVLEPLLAGEDESSDRRYLQVWSEHGFTATQMEERFEKRMRSARHNVTILDLLRKTVTHSTATLTNENAIVKTSMELPTGYVHDLAPRVELARELVAKPQSDLRIADIWEKLREQKNNAVPHDTVMRCDDAIRCRDALSKLRAISVGIEAEYDQNFVKLWQESELQNVADAVALKSEFSRASKCVAVLKKLEQLSVSEPQGMKGESQWVEAGQGLPGEYNHPWKFRVELALALTAQPIPESRIADCWKRIASSKLEVTDVEVQSRCRLAVRRIAAINRLAALESPPAPQEQRDKTFVEIWDEDLFDGCEEADRWRNEAVDAIQRGREWIELERALDEGVDYLRVKRLSSSPRLKHHYSGLEKRKVEIERACKRAEFIEQIQHCVREGRGHDAFAAFESSGMIREDKVLDFYWPELGDFVTYWWESKLKLAPGDREYVLSPDGRQVHISWKFTNPGMEVKFELATSGEQHFHELGGEKGKRRTQLITVAELAAMGGRISLSAPSAGKSLFVTVWAVSICGKNSLISKPLKIGPIISSQKKSEQVRGRSWKSYLWRLLNN